MERYDHTKIEKKWQERWEESGAFKSKDNSQKPKEYLLVEFPYPSGDGLHVGHVRSYTAMDVVARKHRAEGKNVLYPIGWDAFGLPAENYAIKTGVHPKITTKQNTENFKRQIKALGLSFDWSREINTTDPAYYKWTQWIFLELFKKGMAYKTNTLINWCPKDKVTLANEEVVDGACERCGTPVEKREKEQWMLAITKYAQRLYDDLDTVDYIPAAKTGQRNWIGPSAGAEIDFELNFVRNPEANTNRGPNGEKAAIKVFTTRADTLFGATFLVLAPEHPWVKLATDGDHDVLENKQEVLDYITASKSKSEIERTNADKEKTGVELKGVKAINPATKEEIPMYVADYVLGHYGTGAIMAVPAHDERDYAFAKKYNIPVKQVVAPYIFSDGIGTSRSEENIVYFDAATSIIKHWENPDLFYIVHFGTDRSGFVGGHVEEGETTEQTARREAVEESGYTDIKNIKLLLEHSYSRGYKVRKLREEECHDSLYLIELGSDAHIDIVDKEIKAGEWMTSEQILKSSLLVTHHKNFFDHYINEKFMVENGKLVNSGEFTGLMSEEARKRITESVGGKIVTTFKLRDWVFGRQRYWGEPIPMIHCEKDGWVAVPEDQLPVLLPETDTFLPGKEGESPLASMDEWVNTTCPTCGGPGKRETDVMPQWAGSSWYYLRYADAHNDTEFASKDNLKYWTPVNWYNGGMEHTTLHLLYSRFWHKFMYDLGLVPSSEPYMKRTSHGLIMAEDGTKMSKSKGNTVSPDILIEQFGADSLRLYEMFIGPFDQPVPWNSQSILGVRRFLERVWKFAEKLSETTPDIKTESLVQQTIQKISSDIDVLKMNTAVSSLMILSNHLSELDAVPRVAYEVLLKLLAPLAPHMAAELWELAGFPGDIQKQTWPVQDASKLLEETKTIAIQINGKVRATIELPADTEKETALAAARAHGDIAPKLNEGREVKAIYVPGKIINFVVF